MIIKQQHNVTQVSPLPLHIITTENMKQTTTLGEDNGRTVSRKNLYNENKENSIPVGTT